MRTTRVEFGEDGWIEVRTRPVMQDVMEIKEKGLDSAGPDDLVKSSALGAQFVLRWKDDGDVEENIKDGMTVDDFMHLDLDGVTRISEVFVQEILPFLDRFVSRTKQPPSTKP